LCSPTDKKEELDGKEEAWEALEKKKAAVLTQRTKEAVGVCLCMAYLLLFPIINGSM
tara:strand:+ start:89 stop:259 length:171 start_codon:yes stop_codon:yes gene_type:complete